MQETPKRKPRIPLTPEEVFYIKELKKLKEEHRIKLFKASRFYKIVNRVNIVLAGFLTYCILSLFILSKWDKTYVSRTYAIYGQRNPETGQRTVSELQLKTTDGHEIEVYTDDLYEVPEINQPLYLGKDMLFNKVNKVKLAYDTRDFWSINAYASLTVCGFAMLIGCMIYTINKHLSHNGLLMVLGLFSVSSLYFILI